MTKYIKCNEDFVNRAMNACGPCTTAVIGITELLEQEPAADVVEVVRCKDCKDYSSVMFNGKSMHYGYCCNTHDSVIGNRHRYEGDFCSYGKRKEGAEE